MQTRTTPKDIKKLKKNEIFVFGSNAEGNHAGGAAAYAAKHFKAKEGIARGFTGNCYAIDTMSGIDVIIEQITPFIHAAQAKPNKTFLVTELGCGIAGFKPEQIAPLFKDAIAVENIYLPESFWIILKAKQPVRGYKVFNPDFTCRGEKFEIGKHFVFDKPIKICASGYHFCTKASHCFEYYSFDPKNIVCEVLAHGDVETHTEDSKCCTNDLEIVRQLTWAEVLEVSNEGANNTGRSNTGGWNTGDRNTGGWNTGDRNTGYRNTGYSNTGDRNTGGWNTGGWNTGDSNTGYSNTGDRNTGVFCTGQDTMPFFNRPSTWTEQKFRESKVFRLLQDIDTKMWVDSSYMTEEEKKKFPAYITAVGYVKDIPYKEAFMNKWGNWSEENRNEFKRLPNFDAAIFEQITGVKV